MSENSEKIKKPIYKKGWFWLIVILFIIYIIASNSSSPSTQTTSNYQKNLDVEVTVPDFGSMTKDETKVWFDNNKINGTVSEEYSSSIKKDSLISQSISANTVIHEGDSLTIVYSLGKEPTSEEKNALKKALSYSQTMHMSKKGIYKQLISEYGEGFTEEAAQYAIDNVDVDWNANALAKAKSYQSSMNMSKSAIYKQLTSSAGEDFTDEEAQYAIDNLEN